MADIPGQNVVLTGAADGMGRAITKALLDRVLMDLALDQPPHDQIAEMMILPVNRY